MDLLVFWRLQLDWRTQSGVEWREVREDLGRFIVPEGRCDRSLARSAWGKGPSKEPSRRIRYDRAHPRVSYGMKDSGITGDLTSGRALRCPQRTP